MSAAVPINQCVSWKTQNDRFGFQSFSNSKPLVLWINGIIFYPGWDRGNLECLGCFSLAKEKDWIPKVFRQSRWLTWIAIFFLLSLFPWWKSDQKIKADISSSNWDGNSSVYWFPSNLLFVWLLRAKNEWISFGKTHELTHFLHALRILPKTADI